MLCKLWKIELYPAITLPMEETTIHMHTPLDSMRIIHWASGASMSSTLPISDPDPDPGLLGPDSLSWRLHEEQWLIMAGARAFLLQATHPKVAQEPLTIVGSPRTPLDACLVPFRAWRS